MYKQENGWKIEKSEGHVGEGFVLSPPEKDDHQDVRNVVEYWQDNIPDQECDGVNSVCSLDILTESLTLARREILNVRLNISRQTQPPLQTSFLTALLLHPELRLSWLATTDWLAPHPDIEWAADAVLRSTSC